MGNLNMKLMKGIEEAENQMQKEKQPPKSEEPVKKEEKNKDIQKAAGKPQSAKKQSKANSTLMRKKDDKEEDKMFKKQVFSFRAMLNDIVIWKAYAVASGKTMEDICNAAMYEYLKKHKLAGIEQTIFDAIKARDSNSGE